MLRYQAEQRRDEDSRGGSGAGSEGGSDSRVHNDRTGKPNGGMFLDNYTGATSLQRFVSQLWVRTG